MRISTMAAVAATLLALGAPAAAASSTTTVVTQSRPSFNCARARTRVERLICGDAYLGQLDREMARAYRVLQTQIPSHELTALRADQRQWLADRNACLTVDCLVVTYQSRIEFLGGSY